MENTYWNGNGKYQKEYDQMVNDLVPASGKCDTLAGEMIRAVSRLGYDFYNNGMGNNTSGALNFLESQGVTDSDTFATIYEYTRGRIYHGHYNNDRLQESIEHLVDQTVGMILRNPQLMTIENQEDMFDYEEPEQNFCDECGDETDNGYMCEYCEEDYYAEEDEEEYA